MMLRARAVRNWASIVCAILLPLILLYSSIRTFLELDQMRAVYLRNRAAAVAARLEAAPRNMSAQALADHMLEEEPALAAVQIFSEHAAGDPPAVTEIWRGEDLFHTEQVDGKEGSIFRAFVPFHRDGRMHIARLDLAYASADFLVVHARHNVAIAAVSGAALVLLAAYMVWSVRQRARDEHRRLQMQHLAHLGELSAVLAHEIRNPLATMKGFVQLALEQSDSRVTGLLKPVISETKRIEMLVDELLQYGRPPCPEIREIEWQQIGAELQAGAGDPRVSIRPAHLRWASDPGMIKQILQNLIRNAIDAIVSNPDGRVVVSAGQENQTVVMIVEDNGPGISPELREKVFEAFFTTKPFGTGLGLPTARKLATALDGTLTLSAAPAGGMRATLRIPAAAISRVRTSLDPVWN